MKALLIAEKASLARAVNQAYRNNGFKDQIDFFALHGHIMSLYDPAMYNPTWQQWSFDTLPMIPEQFKYRVADQRLFDDLNQRLANGNYDYLINCCDPDREGQHIFYSIYDSIDCQIPVCRMWHNDLSDKELIRALNHMEDDLNTQRLVNLKIASKLRAQMDWLVGMNASRIVTLKRKSLTRLGRVMTPTFKILADRELLIRSFTSDTSYGIDAVFTQGFKARMVDGQDPKKLEFVNFGNKEQCEQMISSLDKQMKVESIESKQVNDNPSQLPSLADIQADCNREYSFTLDKTLELVQSLYEKKLCSYPRTDCCYVTNEVAKEFPKILNAFRPTKSIGPFIQKITKEDIERVCKDKNYVNDSKVTAHYALIPTGLLVGGLSEDEKKVFELICKRFTSIFLKPCKSLRTKVLLNCSGKKFLANGNVLLEKGYRELMGYDRKDEILPELKENDVVDVQQFICSEHTSKAPSRFTDASLLNAMINAANYVQDKELSEILKGDGKVKDNGGIGTPATRAAIVEKLVQPIVNKENPKKNYYLVYRKGKQFYVSDEGLDLMETLKDFDISSPELTAVWEKKLQQIEEGQLTQESFVREMDEYVISMSNQMIQSSYARVTGSFLKCKCPLCGARMKSLNSYFTCENYKKETNGCSFVLSKKINGATLRDSMVEDLCNGKTTKALKMKSQKTGRDYYAGLKFNSETQKVDFVFEDEHLTNYKCPICQGKMIKKYDYNIGDYLICENNDFNVKYTINGRTLKEKEMKQFLTEKELKCTGFIGRNGKEFSSKLIIENGKVAFYFGKKKTENESEESREEKSTQ